MRLGSSAVGRPTRRGQGARLWGRPRYVVGLVAGALALAVYEVALSIPVAIGAYRQSWLFFEARGVDGLWLLAARVVLYVVGAWGLWQGRAWGRLLAMAYLAAELAAFVLLGAGDWRYFFGLHMLMVPLATFGFMYLQRGADDFR